MRIRTIAFGAVIVVASFAAATWVLNLASPTVQHDRPAVASMPPLQPLSGSSTILAPFAVATSAIRDVLEAQAPRNLTGKAKNPLSKLLQNADLNFSIARGPMSVSGRSDALLVTTPLNGTFQARGTLSGEVNQVAGALGGLLGGSIGQQVQNIAGQTFDQHADISGSVTTTARPTIAANWRLAPNLAAQVNMVDVSLPVGGIKLSVSNAVKPFLDNAVREQTAALEARLRNDPFMEVAARNEWTKLCRAIPLGAATPGMPDLWLEIRPVRAIAAQPRIDTDAVTLLIGMQAQTRVVPTETKPDCPFPQQLDIVPQSNDGTVSLAVPIDIPLTEVSRLLAAQVAGKTYPEDGSGAFAVKIKQASVAAAGDRLLIALLVNVRKRGLFSFFGADANVNIWGRPVLDQQNQILRFTDVALDIQSNAAFGLLGTAAQAAAPLLQKTLTDKAAIDLKPLAADAKKRIGAAVSDLARQSPGMAATVVIDDVHLSGIAYDDKTLRIVANATGGVKVAVSSLPIK